MSESSIQATFMIPMAISVAFGVVFAAAISLLLVPAGYLIQDHLRGLLRKCRTNGLPDPDCDLMIGFAG